MEWIEADLSVWEPHRTFDLVTTHYAHPQLPQLDFYERISHWVAPGGTLLIVGHLAGSGPAHAHPPKATADAAGISGRLGAPAWQIVSAEEVARTVTAPNGRRLELHDVIVQARRI
ncbi:hypothetical protein [Aeromicrobium phragmitis]|uniref:hypothetical protein n=1 Tax=Aeromicrobium phragmitis TaxID=2478914 RepID=UPI001FB7D951|nr:hypothetical protein [Aeromicrobium phragmitis]